MPERLLVLLLGCVLGCTAHGNDLPIGGQAEIAPLGVPGETAPVLEPDRFAWLAEVELPSFEHDEVLRFAANAIECPLADPWRPSAELLHPLSLELRGRRTLLYGDLPDVVGFNAAVGLPRDAVPIVVSTYGSVYPAESSWSVEGKLGGFERIAWTPDHSPIRIDGFDAEGRWRRTAMFQHDARLTRRVEFEIVDGVPIRGRTFVFEREQELLIAKIHGDEIEYRRWRTDRGAQRVVFEHHPDRLVRSAQIYENGVPHERVDVLAPLE